MLNQTALTRRELDRVHSIALRLLIQMMMTGKLLA
jgi:hypothetical protein